MAICGSLAVTAARGEALTGEDEPRLVLPGDHQVRPGQWIALR